MNVQTLEKLQWASYPTWSPSVREEVLFLLYSIATVQTWYCCPGNFKWIAVIFGLGILKSLVGIAITLTVEVNEKFHKLQSYRE